MAGPASRILAYAVDFVVIIGVQLGIFVLLFLGALSGSAIFERLREPVTELLEESNPSDPDEFMVSAFFLLLLVVVLMVQLVAEWAYFVASEMATGGRSLGKFVAGLRVVEDGGRPLGLRASVVRNLLRVVDILPSSYLVGLVAMVVSPEHKRLGDLAAGTLVVRLDRPAAAPPLAAGEADASDFSFDRAQIARLDENGRALVRQTLRRVEGLDPERAGEALARAVEVLCQRLEHPPVEPHDHRAFLHSLWRAARHR